MTRLLTIFGACILMAACDAPAPTDKTEATPVRENPDPALFASQAGLSAYTALSSASRTAQALDSKLASFMYHPNPMSQDEVRQAWRRAYDAFLESMVFAYLPIQDPPDWYKERISYQDMLKQLDTWPVQGGYIDYIEGYPFTGIVNDLTLALDEQSLRAQHRFTDETNASLGYHPLEFMIWGDSGKRSPEDFNPQDNTAPVPVTEEGEEEKHTENTDTAGHGPAPQAEPQNHNRRRQYVQLVIELLQKDLHRIQRRWEPSTGYYARILQQSTPEEATQASLIGVQNLILEEILGKRFNLESSEFSGGAALDLVALLNGVNKWFMPEDPAAAEGSMLFLMEQGDPEAASAFTDALQRTTECSAGLADDPAKVPVCRQEAIGLLSALQTASRKIGIALPRLD